ncbi:MAG: phosphodiester glycosidase family protein [Clostridiales bacterium]|nr:phosphodiester glycosidase family protein [Clostridiales bacterium]
MGFRRLAAYLTALLLLTVPAMAYPLADGLAYSEDEGFTLTYTPGADTTVMLLSEGQAWGRVAAETLLDACSCDAVGLVNADFFTMTTGIPEGILVRDGTLICSDSWQNAVGIRADGTVFLGQPHLSMWMQGRHTSFAVSYYNKLRTAAGIYLVDRRFGGPAVDTGDGVNILLRMNRRSDRLTVGGALTARVVSITHEAGVPRVGEGYLLLTCSADGPIDMLADVQVGDAYRLSITSPDTRWQSAVHACGAGQTLVSNGKLLTDLPDDRKPCIALGVRKDGSAVIRAYEDGSLTMLAASLYGMGCISAVNLDGGGSVTVQARLPGTSLTLRNKPSDGKMRDCKNYLVFVNTSDVYGDAAKLWVYPDAVTALPGVTLSFDACATDAHLHPVQSTPTLTSDAGTLKDGKLTVQSSGTVTASYKGAEDGTAYVTVPETVDAIRVSREGRHIRSLRFEPGERVTFTASAVLDGGIVPSVRASYAWETTLGTVDTGVFTAPTRFGSVGTLTVRYGTCTETIRIAVRYGAVHGKPLI